MATKKFHDLGRQDLGKKVRYEFDGDSVTVGVLQSISHYASGQVYITIDKIRHQSSNPEETLEFVEED